MNLHLCSFAPAVARTVCAAAFADLWQRRSYEWTSPWSGSVVRLLDRRHLSASEVAYLDGACAAETHESGPRGSDANGVRGGSGASGDDPSGTLPFTGGPHRGLAAAGVAALISGAIALRRGEGRPRESDPPAGTTIN